ncbi:MAG: cupin domain-containing protein [Spartobacteria bacterium]
MKNTALFFGFMVGFSALAAVAQEKEHKIFAPADLQWTDASPAFPPGSKSVVLDGNPKEKGSFTVRMKSPAGYKIAPHTHPMAERLTVISGTLHVGMGEKFDEAAGREITPGTFAVLPAGMAHFVWTTEECILQVQSEGPFEIKYVNPADDPRNAKK